jgi:plastocyanin
VRVRTIVVLAVGALALAGAGVALAAVTVTLTASGPQPATITVPWGETVVFTNGDAEPHALEIPRETYTSETIPPGGTLEYVFDGRAGAYVVRQLGTRVHQGRVIVEVSGSLTLEAKSPVAYGKRLVVKGTSSVPHSAVTIVRSAPDDPGAWHEIGTAEVAEDGSFVARVELEVGGRLRAEAAAGQVRSGPVRVDVRPVVKIRVADRTVATGQRVQVSGTVAPAGAATTALLEVYNRERKRWARVDSSAVSASGAVKLDYRLEERGRTVLRIALQGSGLRPGFAPATSAWIAVRVS